jgi:hypothetical protein
MYKATQNLSTKNVEMDVKVYFVIYSIDTSMEVPHLKFYLVKDSDTPPEDLVVAAEADPIKGLATLDTYLRQNEYLTFPTIDFNGATHFLFTLYCQGVVESLFHEEREYVKRIQHRGHLVDQDEGMAYVFFELFPTTTEAEYMTRETFIWPVLMHEILQTQSVCDIPIDFEVTSFFVKHPSFIYLSRFLENNAERDEIDNEDVESVTPVEELVSIMPVSVYFPVPNNPHAPSGMDVQKKTQFMAMFGVPRNEEHGNFVCYSYHRAMDLLREMGAGKHGLVRLALYPGKTTIDKEEFEDSPDNPFDTFYHGNEYHVKRYEQQKPMSYHHVVNHAQL